MMIDGYQALPVSVVLEKVEFRDMTASGGGSKSAGIYVDAREGGNVSLDIDQAIFENLFAGNDGAALHVNAVPEGVMDLKISASIFDTCDATFGAGAIHLNFDHSLATLNSEIVSSDFNACSGFSGEQYGFSVARVQQAVKFQIVILLFARPIILGLPFKLPVVLMV
jgi:hypothetical protein